MTTYTNAILITGHDARKNPFSFWKSADGWVDGYNERITDADFIRRHVYPNVQNVIVGRLTMTGAQWLEAGCPIQMTQDEITAIEEAYRLEQATLVEQVAEEVKRDMEWVGITAPAYDAEWEAHCDETSATRASDYPF